MNLKTVTVVCPIYNEERYIERFILSVLRQDYPASKMEVLLIDGMSTDGTRDIVKSYIEKYGYIRLLDNPQRTVPYALNKGIRMSKGDIIVRIDAHCSYPDDYVSKLVNGLERLGADNVGGLWNTLSAKDTVECISIAVASSHPFGVGGSTHKIGTGHIMKVDTVPFGCYRRDVFDRIGMYDEELVRNQDDEFNARLIKSGGSIYILPDVVIDYTARDTMAKMRNMYFQYGLFKPLVNKKLGSPATVRQFFPALFVLGLVLGLLLSIACPLIAAAYVSVLALYFLIGCFVGVRSMLKYKRMALVLYMPYTFLNIHLSYGIGYLKGIYKVLMHKSFNVKPNR